MSNDLFLDDANALVPVWLGGRGDRPAFAIGPSRIFGEVPSHRVRIFVLLNFNHRARSTYASARSVKLESGIVLINSHFTL